jgi:lantibiotic modifying enzyme
LTEQAVTLFARWLTREYGDSGVAPELQPFLTPAARQQLNEGLTRRLIRVITPALAVDQALAVNRFGLADQALRHSHWQTVLDDQDGLTAIIEQTVRFWQATSGEMLRRFQEDASMLQPWLSQTGSGSSGILTGIDAPLSDLHNAGRCVARLALHGDTLLYKPRPLQIDQAWSALCAWLQAHQAPYVPIAPAVIDRGEYGWVKPVIADAVLHGEQTAKLAFNLGNLLALFYALGAVDCHYGNFILQALHPVIVDCETLMQPRFLSPLQPAWVDDSVLHTELLPCQYRSPGAQQITVPGFDLAFDARSVSGKLATKSTLATHFAPLNAGFAAMYRFLLQRKNRFLANSQQSTHPLKLFRHAPVRFIYRSTMTYERTMTNYLTRLATRRDKTEAFAKLRVYEPVDAPSALREALHAAEQQALGQMDIPYFSAQASEKHLTLASGTVNAFSVSAFDLALQRLAKLSEEDLTQQQKVMMQAVAGTLIP